MNMKTKIRHLAVAVTVIFVGTTILAYAIPRLPSRQQDQQNQADQQKSSDQQNQDQSQSDQQPKKKKGGIFGGMKSITAAGSGQSKDTASAGTKGVGEGKRIGNLTPTATDVAAVGSMEQYSVPEKDLKKFQQDGHLQSNQ